MANAQYKPSGGYSPLEEEEKAPPPYDTNDAARRPHVTIALPSQLSATAQARNERYKSKAGRVTGFLQMCVGTMVWILGIVLAAETPVVQEWTSHFLVGTLFIVSGVVGLVSRNRNNCVITTYMVTCIVSAVGACFLVLRAVATGVDAELVYDGPWHCVISHNKRVCFDVRVKVIVAIASLTSICGFIELIIAIVGAAFCCAGVCKCFGTTRTAIVMYSAPVPDIHATAVGLPPMYATQTTNPPPSYETQIVT